MSKNKTFIVKVEHKAINHGFWHVKANDEKQAKELVRDVLDGYAIENPSCNETEHVFGHESGDDAYYYCDGEIVEVKEEDKVKTAA